MSIKKIEENDNISYTIIDIDKDELECLFNALNTAHLPEKRYLGDLTKEIKQFL